MNSTKVPINVIVDMFMLYVALKQHTTEEVAIGKDTKTIEVKEDGFKRIWAVPGAVMPTPQYQLAAISN
jgi:hypothetical protein